MTHSMGCPEPEELLDWASGTIADGRREILIEHIAACAPCREKIARIKRYETQPPPEAEPPAHLRGRVRKMAEKPPHPGASRHGWLGVFALFLVLSFVFPKYYMQMLLVAAVAAGKWLLDSRRTHVFINLKREEKEKIKNRNRLHDQSEAGRD